MEKEFAKHMIEYWEQTLFNYCNEHCNSSDGDGDWVEFMESDDYCIEILNKIDKLKEKLNESNKLN